MASQAHTAPARVWMLRESRAGREGAAGEAGSRSRGTFGKRDNSRLSLHGRVIIINYDLMSVSKYPEEAISNEECLR